MATRYSPVPALSACALLLTLALPAQAEEFTFNGHTFNLPDGFTLEQIAGPPLVRSPICMDFDEQGRLYVADSSGSNDPVKKQLEERPHRIVRLVDTDGDGIFDKSTVFADRMMFPEGAMWYDGSLYVGAPPQIWKLTDTDDDGVADKREIWFDGKTLNGCANDMHGPYVGPDGWIYWCKGAFEEQTHLLVNGKTLVTRASHIFRRRPEGGPIEPVMTGGMDNPVEVVFTPGGERIFTTTFLQHPGNGRRDGLIHAIYGGVYGKVHGVLEGHPRTGEVMPVLAQLGAAAPCGLARIESSQLGPEYRNNVMACLFNMRKITRHVISKEGAGFVSEHEDFLVSNNLDFHPTDVLEDADGSLVVIDTGGWYKLCCPTSQLWKPDILGAIYRVRRTGSHQLQDPRGLKTDWNSLTPDELGLLLGEERFAIRNRAREQFGTIEVGPAVKALEKVLATSRSSQQRLHAVWALSRIDDDKARRATRSALADTDAVVRQAALHTISVHRDLAAGEELTAMLASDSEHNRRAAAEALGRIGSPADVSTLLDAIANCQDRSLQHSLTYAVMEIGGAEEIHRLMLATTNAQVRRAGLIALDQMESDILSADEVLPLLASDDAVLRDTAWWIVEHHDSWADQLAPYLQKWISSRPLDADSLVLVSQRLARFAKVTTVQQVLARELADADTPSAIRTALLDAMISSGLKTIPASWNAPLLEQLHSTNAAILERAVEAARVLGPAAADKQYVERLGQLAGEKSASAPLRLRALAAMPAARRPLSEPVMNFLVAHLHIDHPVVVRALAVDILLDSPLNVGQWIDVADALPTIGPMELTRLMEGFGKQRDQALGSTLVDNLGHSPALTSLRAEQLEKYLSGFGTELVASAAPLFETIARENEEKNAKLETVLKLVPEADIRRGLAVFRDTRAACITCHQMAYLGGQIGPDLSRIGQIRSERDLLESILFPSASFVRSYESTTVVTTDGRVLNGMIKDETSRHIELVLDAHKKERIPLEEIEERRQGTISIMPVGLDKQLTAQQLADLVKYLKSR
jgi:putative membrane-bound dehydrogenase-like protein